MPVIVEAPDGTEIEFPDGMSEEEMHRSLSEHFSKSTPKPQSPTEFLSAGEAPSLLQRFRRTGFAKEIGLESAGARALRESQVGVAKPDVASAGGEGFIPALSHPMVPLDVLKGDIDPKGPLLERILRSTWNAGVGLAEFAESPLGIATAGAGELAQIPKAVLTAREGMAGADVASAARNLQTIATANRVGAAGYAGQMTASAPEAARELGEVSVEPGRGPEAGVGLASTILLPALPAALATRGGPNARSIEQAAAVHGNVRPLGAPAEVVPAEVSRGGVQPEAKAASEKGQTRLLLTPEDQAYLDAERKGISAPVELVGEVPGDQPFARQIATVDRKNGRVLLNPKLFSEWLSNIPEDRRAQAVRSLLSEEQIHLHVDDASALDYWNNLTAAEKSIQRKRYTGKWRGDSTISDTNMGHEAVRFRMQQLARMTPREIAEVVGRERWTVQGLTAVESAIRTAREALGTKASGTQLAIIDRMQSNLNAAKVAVGGTPGALSKSKSDVDKLVDDIEAADGEGYRRLVTGENGRPDVTGNAYRVGDATTSVDELNRLLKGRTEARRQFTDAMESGKLDIALSTKGQFFREAIERATKSGSAETETPDTAPLNYRTHPEVAKWLVDHSKELGFSEDAIAPVKEFLASNAEPGAYMKKGEQGFDDYLRSVLERSKSRDPEVMAQAFFGTREGAASADGILEELSGTGKTSDEVISDFFARVHPNLDPAQRAAIEKWFERNTGVTLKEVGGTWEDTLKNSVQSNDPSQLEGTDRGLIALLEYGNRHFRPAPEQSFPAAYMKKAPKDQPELGLPPLEDVAAPKRLAGQRAPKLEGLQEMLPLPRAEKGETRESPFETITPEKVSQFAAQHLAGGTPNFKDFVGEAQGKFGGIQKGQLRDVWTDAMWKHLLTAPGKELERLRTQLKLGRHFGSRPVADYARRAPEQKAMMPGEVSAQAQARIAEGQRSFAAQQKYRNNVMRGIATELAKQTEEGSASLRRSTLSADDIAWNRPSSFNAYREISAEEAASPQMLERLATENFRASSSKPETHTRRVLALVNKSTGEVELVSAYLHPRSGVMVVDPKLTGKMRPNVMLAGLLKNYRPIATVLLDEPVQNFRQRFESVGQFNEQFADQARNEIQAQASYEATLDPSAGVVEPGEPPSPNRYRNLTDTETVALLDHYYDANQGIPIESVENVKLAMKDVADLTDLGERPHQAFNAYLKMYDRIREEFPELSEGEAIDLLANRLYEDTTASKTREEFVARTMGRYQDQTREAVPGPRQAAGSEGSRELTMRERPAPIETVPVHPRGNPNPYPYERGPGHPYLAEGKGVLQAKMEPEIPAGIQRRPRLLPEGGGVYMQPVPAETPAGPVAIRRTTDLTKGPGAYLKKAKEAAQDEFVKLRGQMQALGSRKEAKDDMAKLRDRADTLANVFADQAEKSVRLETARGAKGIGEKLSGQVQRGNPQVLAAAKAVVQSGFDQAKLGQFFNATQAGIQRAEQLLQSGSMSDKRVARRWLAAAQKLRSEVEYARSHWTDPELQATSQAVKDELELQYQRETASGRNLKHDANYLPGRYDAELFGDDAVTFGGRKDILGRQWRAPKTFASYYDAIAAGPYIPATYDAASLVGHRVRQGQQQLNKALWVQALKNIQDPHSGTPAVTTATKRPDGTFAPPTPEHVLVYPTPGQDPVAVRKDFASTIRNLSGVSAVQDMPAVPHVLELGQLLKHTILLGDFFHLARLGYYSAAIMGRKAGFRGGASALEYRPGDLQRAVTKGLVRPQDAAWASQPVNVNLRGRTVAMSRNEIARAAMDQGLNVGRIQDALYKDMVAGIPVLGRYNKWLFDRFTRGLMLETAVREFERLNKANPGVESRKLMRDIARDTNNFYGSIGRQGWFKNPTLQDLTRIALLAPQWVEGLVKKEAALPARLTGLTKLAGRKELPALGTTGRGIGRGLVAMLALTQAANIITRGKPTWQNEEEGHKFDAWIPGKGDSPGAWISPLSIYNELSHDLVRYFESKPKFWDAVNQIGENKFGPWARAALVLKTSKTATGEQITTTPGVLKEAAKSMAPVPISFGRVGQAALHRVAPGVVPPTQEGAVERQVLGTLGIKAEVASSAGKRIANLADAFLEREGLKRETGYANTPTDEASYSKLRGALRTNDTAGATRLLKRLLVGRNPEDVLNAMVRWKESNFTGNDTNETKFKWSLTEPELELYHQAIADRQKTFERFVELYLQQ